MYNLTYTGFVNLLQIENIASMGIIAHGVVWSLFAVLLLSLFPRFGNFGDTLIVSSMGTAVFTIFWVAIGVGNPADFVLITILLIVGLLIR